MGRSRCMKSAHALTGSELGECEYQRLIITKLHMNIIIVMIIWSPSPVAHSCDLRFYKERLVSIESSLKIIEHYVGEHGSYTLINTLLKCLLMSCDVWHTLLLSSSCVHLQGALGEATIRFVITDNMYFYTQLPIAALLLGAVRCLHVNRRNSALREVPDDIDPSVTTLDLSMNNIEVISITSLAAFEYLIILNIKANNIRVIEEGAFDNNRFLSVLEVTNNMVDTMPSSFGAAKDSLTQLHFWIAFTTNGISHANFSECLKLRFLNVGGNSYPDIDVSIFPHDLIELVMNYMNLVEFPDLRFQTPYLEVLHIENNVIVNIPPERLNGLKYLKTIYMAGNMFTILPDVTDTPITKISLAGNPLSCKVSHLCYLHVLDIVDAPECDTPEVYRGQLVTDMIASTTDCDAGG